MLNSLTENNLQCPANITGPITLENNGILNKCYIFFRAFIVNIIFRVLLLYLKTLCDTVKEQKCTIKPSNDDKSPDITVIKKKRFVERYHKSCPPSIMNFQAEEDAANLTAEELKEITLKDRNAQQEKNREYRAGGYIPIQTGQSLGILNQYVVIRKLGWGHFSTVWLCKQILNQEHFAIKIVKASTMFKYVAQDEIRFLNYVREKDASHEGHNYIILLKDYFTEKSVNGSHVCLSFELMGPSLLDLIVQSDYKGLEQSGVINIITQVLKGLKYLHEVCRLIHTDIKPENILICAKASYIQNMVEQANRFKELRVQMPKSYVSSKEWEQYVMQEKQLLSASTSSSRNSTDSPNERDRSCPQLSRNFLELSNMLKQNLRVNESHSAAFVDPNIHIKIADLGNCCWEDVQFSDLIQTVQYRALEVIINAKYSFPADIWSVGCLAFELSTGEFLFNPHRTSHCSTPEDHLGLIWEVLDGIPKYVAMSGKYSTKYFNTSGVLKHIRPKNLKIWKVEDVLVDKYKWKRVNAIVFADFIQSLIEPDPELRATASVALTKDWIKGTDNS